MEKPNQISETFNVERILADMLDKFLKSAKSNSKEFQVEVAKGMIEALKIAEIPYNYPKTNFVIGGKSHGIDACDGCGIQTYQTATETGWVCDRCGKDCN